MYDMDNEEQKAILTEIRLLNISAERLEQTLEDVAYLKDMRIACLERELGEAREALEEAQQAMAFTILAGGAVLALADKSIVTRKVQAAEVRARAALAPKEPKSENPE